MGDAAVNFIHDIVDKSQSDKVKTPVVVVAVVAGIFREQGSLGLTYSPNIVNRVKTFPKLSTSRSVTRSPS